MIRWVKPEPGPVVKVDTQLLPTSRSFALLVVTEPLLLVVLFPVAAAVTSNALVVLIPLYSPMRTSGIKTPALNVTVTVLAPAAAATMFCA
jgi:hypothetical protein